MRRRQSQLSKIASSDLPDFSLSSAYLFTHYPLGCAFINTHFTQMDFVFTLAALLPFTPSTGAVENTAGHGDAPRDFDAGSGYCVVA
ncbi:hypothetical protein RSAG8_05373, partial [Rhizoctonia solani AG-8 WAC10335]